LIQKDDLMKATTMGTVIGTILSGVVVFVLGQFALRLIVDPLQEFSKIRGEINSTLIYYANFISNPGTGSSEKQNQISDNLRKLSGQLMASVNSIKLYMFLFRLRLAPCSLDDVVKSARKLIFLSNSVHQGHGRENSEAISNLMRYLKLAPEKSDEKV
jgi:hypothetical protein